MSQQSPSSPDHRDDVIALLIVTMKLLIALVKAANTFGGMLG